MWRDTFFSGDREKMGERDDPWSTSGKQNSEASEEGCTGKDPGRLCLSLPARREQVPGLRGQGQPPSGTAEGSRLGEKSGVFLGVGAGAGEEREGRRFLNECKILRAQKREGREGPRGGKGWREKEEEEVGGGRRVRDSD